MFDYASKDCFVVLNGDDDKLSNVKKVNGHAPVFFGIDTDRDVMAIKYESLGIQGTKVKIKYFDKELDTVIPIPGYHMIYNAMAAVCIGSHFGMTLDEIDSGLDVDSLRIVGTNVIDYYKDNKPGVLLITHYNRLLEYIKPDYVHIMKNGHIIKTGDYSLVKEIEENGYDAYGDVNEQ